LDEVLVKEFVGAADFASERQRVKGKAQLHDLSVRVLGVALAGVEEESAFGGEPDLFWGFGAHGLGLRISAKCISRQ
jgi:hypothetical protein